MHQLIPGMMLALREGRDDDALHLAQAIADEVDHPEMALLEVAAAGNYLHRHPEVPLAQLALMLREDELGELDDPRTLGVLSSEFLDVVRELVDQEDDQPLSEQARGLLATYDVRPGSAAIIQQLAQVTAALVACLRLSVNVQSASSDSAQRAVEKAFTDVRAALKQDGGNVGD
jgi:hypothetical protein